MLVEHARRHLGGEVLRRRAWRAPSSSSCSTFDDLLLETLALGGDVDETFQREEQLAERRERGGGALRCGPGASTTSSGSALSRSCSTAVRAAASSPLGRRTKRTRLLDAMLKSRRKPRPAFTTSYLAFGELLVGFVEAVVRVEIVVRAASASGANMIVWPPWSSGRSRVETEAVPELLGDERQERMEQPQRVPEHEVDHRERVRFARGDPVAVERGFAGLEIPVAELAPEKAVERLRWRR